MKVHIDADGDALCGLCGSYASHYADCEYSGRECAACYLEPDSECASCAFAERVRMISQAFGTMADAGRNMPKLPGLSTRDLAPYRVKSLAPSLQLDYAAMGYPHLAPPAPGSRADLQAMLRERVPMGALPFLVLATRGGWCREQARCFALWLLRLTGHEVIER